ncbi:hypothetical protein [Xylophilus sp.]|uniref:hypothetical protein n=1 Tax=Xylophilus sp. TaxID=2653893 RepID=UPI002D804E4D|nr:hypothetical protein [Xylophilus sp.]
MSAGIQLIGASGAWQADESFASLALRIQGTAKFSTVTGAPPFNLAVTAQVTAQGDAPVIAVRADFAIVLTGCYVNGTTWQWSFAAPDNAQDGHNAGREFAWFVFDRPLDLGSQAGLQVFDAQGRMTFDGMQRYLRVAGVVPGSQGGQPGSLDFPGITTAMIFTRVAIVTSVFQPTPGSPYVDQVSFSGARVDGTSVRVVSFSAHFLQGIVPPGGPYPAIPAGDVLVADVSNY